MWASGASERAKSILDCGTLGTGLCAEKADAYVPANIGSAFIPGHGRPLVNNN